MATLMEFAAMQLERETGIRSAFPEGETPSETRPASIFWSEAAISRLVDGGDGRKMIKASTLVIGAHGTGAATIEATLPDSSLKHLGLIILPELSVRGCVPSKTPSPGTCALWCSVADPDVVYCNVSHTVPPERSAAFAREVTACVDSSRTVILEQATAKQFGYSLEEVNSVAIKTLSTDKAPKGDAESCVPPGAIITGVSAAFLAQCQVRGRNATLYVAVTPDDGDAHGPASVTQLSVVVSEASGDKARGGMRAGDALKTYLRERDEAILGVGGNPLYI